MLPLKLKWILRREFWPQFQNLLKHGTEIHKGYLDDPRNTDNAWVETVAISVHFDDQNDVEMKRMNSVRASCLHGSLTWLQAGMGHVRPQARQILPRN
uniref:Nudix hydrolase domain-containing protein n=1 Tax=Dromaius novaehollandiae TaxID=8790 RepID=A0A8C4KNU9_DRONO